MMDTYGPYPDDHAAVVGEPEFAEAAERAEYPSPADTAVIAWAPGSLEEYVTGRRVSLAAAAERAARAAWDAWQAEVAGAGRPEELARLAGVVHDAAARYHEEWEIAYYAGGYGC